MRLLKSPGAQVPPPTRCSACRSGCNAARPYSSTHPAAQANNGLSVGENAAVLAGITVAVRCLAGALLWGLHRAKRL